MAYQNELFPPPVGFRPENERKEPRLWVKELRVYKVLSPKDTDILRRIELRPGLNILWAKPREPSNSERRSARRVSGHATGKTTFCRFLRYLLGESTFGNDEQRERLRKVFPDGGVVGEVHLEGTPWLVYRPFRIGGVSHAAYRGRTIDSLFASEEGRETFEAYRQELNRLFAEPLPVATFATNPTPIEWPHLLQWLTRDQECRFAGLAELRHASSDSQSPNMSTEDTHFLFRAVLNLIDTAEQAELETNKRLLKNKQEAERLAPLLRYRGDSAYQRLRDQLDDFRLDLQGADFLDAVHREWTIRANSFETEINTIEEPSSLREARNHLHETERELRNAEEKKLEIEKILEWIEQQSRQLRGDISKTDLAAWLQANRSSEHECGRTLLEAIEWECPLAVGRKLPTEARPKAVPTASSQAQLEDQKSREEKRLNQVLLAIWEHKSRVAIAASALKNENKAYDRHRAGLAQRQAVDQAIAVEAKRAHNDKAEADRLDSKLKDLEQEIRVSQEKQAGIREKCNSALSDFSETFARVARAIIEDEVQGKIRFHGRKVRPTLTNEIDMTSAALETLKIICFDLAALISGIEGRSHHPLFLIHDGPREADMDADLYREIFRLIHSLEESFGERPVSFQYIVTTTEGPPELLAREPWLLEPVLDASIPGGKLLGENF